MSDKVTNDLLLEHLKSIQSKLRNHDEHFNRIENELSAIKSHISGLVKSDLNRDADIASLSVRVDRIERRLEISD